jgi:hypothetical protein
MLYIRRIAGSCLPEIEVHEIRLVVAKALESNNYAQHNTRASYIAGTTRQAQSKPLHTLTIYTLPTRIHVRKSRLTTDLPRRALI